MRNGWGKTEGGMELEVKGRRKRPNVPTCSSIEGAGGCKGKDHTQGKVQYEGPD